MSTECRCVLLHVRELSESKKILECFSEEMGRIALVINVNSQPIPDYFRLFEVKVYGGTALKTLQSYQYAQPFIDFEPQKQIVALYFNELLFHLTKPYDAHPWLLPFYLAHLVKLKSYNDFNVILREFEFELLEKIGFAIDFEKDADGEAFDMNQWYQFVGLNGFKLSHFESSKNINGAMINQLKQKQWTQSPNNKVIQFVLTSQIQAILGDHTLKSRQLWPRRQRAKEGK